jgi:nucleoid-associated protein YgaU
MSTPEDRSKPAPSAGTAPKPTDSAADNPYAQHYVVQKGDTLSKIAEEVYGDKMLYPQIFEANRDILSDPNKLKPGQKLRIP